MGFAQTSLSTDVRNAGCCLVRWPVQEYRMGVCTWSIGLYLWILANGLWPHPFSRYAWGGLLVATIVFLLVAKETDFVVGRLAKIFKFAMFGFTEYHLATGLSWFLAWLAKSAT